ncbi:PLP-dependent transferase [Hymenopellis radicata]|nr:PLP-dependent transferase [Hymenopellis radicata]
MDDWGIDVVLTASQKGLGVPPGLSILVAGPKAIEVFEKRTTPVAAYYASWTKWLPIMRSYDAGKPAYFATPAVNLIYAYHASLKQITSSDEALQERFLAHQRASDRIKALARHLGFKEVPLREGGKANGMTAVYVPQGYKPSDVMPKLTESGVIIAGGIHKDIKDKYIRIGHMGTSVVDDRRGDVEKIEKALEESVKCTVDSTVAVD